jgi:hypothetical protein
MSRAGRAISHGLLALAVLAGTPLARAFSIEGLPLLAPLTLREVSASVVRQTLEIPYPGGSLSIYPWPEFLPPQMSGQVLQAERQPWPAGPSDQVSFTQAGERLPWLILGSHSRPATRVVGDWLLQRSAGNWYLTNGKQQTLLNDRAGNSQPIRVAACEARWDVYLLADSQQKSPGTASSEREPRISWAAVRR